jgi:neutral amino acid transport system permease protein
MRAIAAVAAGVAGLLMVSAVLLGAFASPATAAPPSTPAASSAPASPGAPSSTPQPAEAIQGTLRGPVGPGGASAPVPGVKITVSQSGKEIGTATTDNDGKWLIALPGAGTYQVTLDVKTLPPGVHPRNPGRETIPALVVQPNSAKFAIFPLVKEGAATGNNNNGNNNGNSTAGEGNSQLSYLLSVAQVGIEFGLIIAMTAVGLSLIFGTTRLINFAHGEMVTLGAVVVYVFGTSPLRWPFAVAIILGILAVALLGGLLELGLWRPLRKRGTGLIQMFIISIGLSLLLRNGIQYFFGTQREQFVQATTEAPLNLGPLSVAPRDLIIMGLSLVILIAIAVLLQRTRIGKAMRALADNRDLAEASGINVDRVVLQVWVIGGGLAAVGGVLFGLTTAVSFDMGFHLLLLMFAGIILGGLGSAYGAMLGSIVVGLVAQFSTVWFPAELENAWAMVVLIVVLLVRPQGILGRLQRAG